MNSLLSNQSLQGRTILIAPSDSPTIELSQELEGLGARVLQCRKVEIVEPESYAALDDAIENLFGYDWLVFLNEQAVEFFLRRFTSLGKDLTELDALRVCAIGEATATKLGHERVHFDLVSAHLRTNDLLAALETFVGGPSSLRGLNFLIPRASSSHETLSQALKETGSRVDVVAAYRPDLREVLDFARLNALLAGDSIDCVIFTSPYSVKYFARLFDTNDLSQLLSRANVACADRLTERTAAGFGLQTVSTAPKSALPSLVHAVAGLFH